MIERHKLGMLLFISSEAVFFGALIVTYLVNVDGTGAEATTALFNVPLVALFSLALFASSATIAIAHRRLDHGDVPGMRWWLLATFALGAIFLVGQAIEYRELLLHNITLARGVFPATFFTLTGFHGLHVLVGLIAILILWSVANTPGFARRRGEAFEPVSIYWHFVDVVWVVIFSLVYLWTLV